MKLQRRFRAALEGGHDLRAGTPMLSAYVPHGSSLERLPIAEGAEVPPSAVWIDLATPAIGEDKTVERLRRHRGSDARGNAGDRGLEPALCRERRAVHDRDLDVPVRHGGAEDHADHLHPGRATASSPCATTSRGRS